MMRTHGILLTWAFTCSALSYAPRAEPAQASAPGAGSPAAGSLAGVWGAQRRFGPDVSGSLVLLETPDRWRAEVGGEVAEVHVSHDELSFALARGHGRFRGARDEEGSVRGHWIQPPLVRIGREVASPVRLERAGEGRWVGELHPREDRMTLFLVLSMRADGTLGSFLRNPERNLGVFLDLDHVEREGNRLRFVGRARGAAEPSVLIEGAYRPSDDRIVVSLPALGGDYELARVRADSPFYARGRAPHAWVYDPPAPGRDGWPTAKLEDVGIDVEPLKELIETRVDSPATDVHAPYPHAILIARHGKLVFEEYFHGFGPDEPHDTRSASKSATSVLAGAAMRSGVDLDVDTRVYELLAERYDLPDDLDLSKLDMTLEHLLTMSSGHACDDGNPRAPGNEDVMQSQTAEPDWYRYTLGVPMSAAPGTAPVYCSADANLIGAVLSVATGRRLEDLFDELVAVPLELGEYDLILQPSGEPYMGGGIHWLPRDFLKLGQLMLDGGTWKGHGVVTPDWASRSTTRHGELGGRGYGYLWWVDEYPFHGREVEGFLAGGNGGQVVIGVPELDLVVLFFAGNYSDATTFVYQREWMPEFLLRAVRE